AFQTGVGLATLISEAEKLGRKDELLAALKNITTVCRGPKPTAVMARHGLRPSVTTREPYTTTELLEAMAPLELTGKTVAVLHYGERNAALAEALKTRGAKLDEMCLYEWQMPEDTAPLKNLIQELSQGAFDVVAFTSQIQARHLFQIAAESGREDEVRNALNEKAVVASIGPTCTAALDKLGVKAKVEPKNPKMAPMVQALTEYFDKQ
ncbi:MAG TPA: uroporphyrinogen-III synthase, partial [Blastocatellia bacterium]|nr:uroporphyrinogen-III synthase [Blastocatellia bacterium]